MSGKSTGYCIQMHKQRKRADEAEAELAELKRTLSEATEENADLKRKLNMFEGSAFNKEAVEAFYNVGNQKVFASNSALKKIRTAQEKTRQLAAKYNKRGQEINRLNKLVGERNAQIEEMQELWSKIMKDRVRTSVRNMITTLTDEEDLLLSEAVDNYRKDGHFIPNEILEHLNNLSKSKTELQAKLAKFEPIKDVNIKLVEQCVANMKRGRGFQSDEMYNWKMEDGRRIFRLELDVKSRDEAIESLGKKIDNFEELIGPHLDSIDQSIANMKKHARFCPDATQHYIELLEARDE